jgi:hypothetical protein
MTRSDSLRRGSFDLLPAVLLLFAVLGATFASLRAGGSHVRAFVGAVTDLGACFPKYDHPADRIAAGHLPRRNSYEFGGIPFPATIQPAVFAPPKRIFFFLWSGEHADELPFVAQLVVAALGTLLFARDLGRALWPAILATCWVTQPTGLVRLHDHPIGVAGTTWLPPFAAEPPRRAPADRSADLSARARRAAGAHELLPTRQASGEALSAGHERLPGTNPAPLARALHRRPRRTLWARAF